MADKKTNSKTNKNTKNNKNNKKKKNSKQKKLSFYETHHSALMLIYLLVSLFLLSIAVIPGYNIWAVIRGFFFGVFGIGFFVFVISMFVIGIKIALDKLSKNFIAETVSGTFIAVLFDSLIHLFTTKIEAGGLAEFSSQIGDAYHKGYSIAFNGFNASGGVLGSIIGGGLLHSCGKVAGIMIALVLLIVAIMLYFDISFNSLSELVSSIINKSKNKFDETHESNKVKRAEKAEIRREERRKKQEEQKQRELDAQHQNDDFDFNKSEIELDDNFKVRRSRQLKPYNPPDRLFTYVKQSNSISESDSVEVEEIDTSDIVNTDEATEIKLLDFENQLPDGFEELDIDDNSESVLSSEAESIVESAIIEKQKFDEKNQNEVSQYVEEVKKKKEYSLPPIDCLKEPDFSKSGDYATEMKQTAKKLVDTLKSFGVETNLIGVSRGPSVTRYELQPAPGVKISKITGLADDIALNLASSGVRIEAPIPNKSAVGIEVPNQIRSTVLLREIISSSEFQNSKSKLTVALGKDISGNVNCADIVKMPHLLIAGTTGSGKSVCLNGMIASILYNAKPDEVKLLMIDPKQVEFSVYNGIPHLLVPVISDVRKAAGSLAWAVGEMENRYKLFSTCGVRDIKGFNKYIVNHPEFEFMPQIVIFIDELNDLMMISPKEVEDSICRLAQKARAAGMHLVVATQRPSVDVITGIIKANIPSRISLSVSSQVDSRTILDSVGAEKLLGNGDMLYNPVGIGKPVRIQGAFLSDEEIESIVDFIKNQEEVEYDSEVMEEIERNAVVEKKKNSLASAGDEASDGGDVMFNQAIEVVVQCQAASTTLLQRKLRLGYARAARIMDELEQKGIVSPADGSKQRKVLITQAQLIEMKAMGNGVDDSQGEDFDILSDD